MLKVRMPYIQPNINCMGLGKTTLTADQKQALHVAQLFLIAKYDTHSIDKQTLIFEIDTDTLIELVVDHSDAQKLMKFYHIQEA